MSESRTHEPGIQFSLLWAKTSRDPARPMAWHPLVAHLLDTLAVGTLWIEHHAARPVLQNAAVGLGWDEETLRLALPALVALHDLGKASVAFQMKWPPAISLLEAAGLAPGTGAVVPASLPAHGPLGVPMICAALMRRMGWTTEQADLVARCLGAHHGMPVAASTQQIRDGVIWGVTQRSEPLWAAARIGLVDAVLDAGLPHGLEFPPAHVTPVGALHLLGATTVIDWVASQEDIFQPAYSVTDPVALETLDPQEYYQQAQRLAGAALAHAGFLRRRRRTSKAHTFRDLFPAFTPRPLQRVADQLLADADGQFLLVVEDAMGQGKTEVAFQAVATGHRLGAAGSYLALPTRATSDQAFSRLHDFLGSALREKGQQLHLLHATAWMNAEYQDIRVTDLRDEADPQAGVLAAEWFARPKRGLLGEHAVGTVDQAMLGVLTVRHHWVRLWGLAGKVVVLDEIHAYDTFMTTIIERLLSWLAASGASVVLLSATLPAARRRSLVESFERGAGWGVRDLALGPYPRAELRTAVFAEQLSPPTDQITTRSVRLEWCGNHADQIAARAMAACAAGGCIAVVCNTVRRAREVFDAVVNRLSGDGSERQPEVHLFTSRFRSIERSEIEALVLRCFGKPGPGVVRPARAVLVATQVIEQSLDLDFDMMITEFAPSDLILQRAGRVHRHDGRKRSTGVSKPRVLVTRPERDADGQPIFETGSTRVYEEHVLVRSFAALGALPRELALPADIERVVQATYDLNASVPPELRPAWERTLGAFRDRRLVQQSNASAELISGPDADPYAQPGRLWNPDDEAEQVSTRVGVDAATLVILGPHEHGLLDDYARADSVRPRVRARRELMMRALSAPPWSRPFGTDTPVAWRQDAALRRSVLIETDADGRFRDASGLTWCYDLERGWARI